MIRRIVFILCLLPFVTQAQRIYVLNYDTVKVVNGVFKVTKQPTHVSGTQRLLTVDSLTGEYKWIRSTQVGSGGSGVNIYNSDGTLTGFRRVNLNGNAIAFGDTSPTASSGVFGGGATFSSMGFNTYNSGYGTTKFGASTIYQDGQIDMSVYNYQSGKERHLMFNQDSTNVFRDDYGRGLKYFADYSANFTSRSIPDVAYVLAHVGGSYTAGYGLGLTGTQFRADSTVLVTKTFAGKYEVLSNKINDFSTINSVRYPTTLAVSNYITAQGYVTPTSTTTFTNKSISGSTNTLSNIANASLTNSAITLNGTSTSLGGSFTVTKNNTDTTSTGFLPKSNLYPLGDVRYAKITSLSNKADSARLYNGNQSIYRAVPVVQSVPDSVEFLGDSFGSSLGLANPSNGFSQLATTLLGSIIINHAVSGSTLEKRVPIDGNGGLNGVDQSALVHTYNSHMRGVVIALGYNDVRYNGVNYTTTNFTTDLNTIISNIEAKGWPANKIYVVAAWYCTPTSYTSISGNAAATFTRHAAFINAAKAAASTATIGYMDAYNLIKSNGAGSLMQTDSTHENETANKMIAEKLVATIGYSIRQTGQQLAVNNITELAKLHLSPADTLVTNATEIPVIADTAGYLHMSKHGYVQLNPASMQGGFINVSGNITGRTFNALIDANIAGQTSIGGGLKIKGAFPTVQTNLLLGSTGGINYIEGLDNSGVAAPLYLNKLNNGAVSIGNGGLSIGGLLGTFGGLNVAAGGFMVNSGYASNKTGLNLGLSGTASYIDPYTSVANTTGSALNIATLAQAPIVFGNGLMTIGSLTASLPVFTNASKQLTSTGTVPIANGGTGSATQNFVDLTTAQTVAGNKTFSSTITLNSQTFVTLLGQNNNNIFQSSSTTGASVTAVPYLFGGATTVNSRISFGQGSVTPQLTTGQAYAGVEIPRSTIQTFTSATHSVIAGTVFMAPAITYSGATVTDAANVYSQGAPTNATGNSWNGWFKYGTTRVSGLQVDSIANYKGVTGGLSVTTASNDLTAQTTAGNVTTFTVGASTATFNISAYLNITAVTVDVIETQVTYTDENNTAQTANFFTMGATSALLSSIGNSAYPVMTIRAKNATVITVKTTLTTGTGSISYDAGSRINQL